MILTDIVIAVIAPQTSTRNVSGDSLYSLVVVRWPSLFNLGNIVYRSCGVRFVQQEVSLHLCCADLRVGRQRARGKPRSFRRGFVWVEPLEHLLKLPVRAVADVLLQIHAAWSDQRCI